jgi:succinate dehydrogenase hydrophobic anchor subunit
MNLDFMMWIFTRLSGVLLILFGLGAGVAALVMGARTQMDFPTLLRWMFFPIPGHVLRSDIQDFRRWMGAGWQVLQLLVVVFGVTHGVNGLRMVLEDRLGGAQVRGGLRGALLVLWLSMIIFAIFIIFGL